MTDRESSPDALDRRIDAALRRRFVPSDRLASLTAPVPQRPRPSVRPWWIAAGALAAGWIAWVVLERPGPEVRPASPETERLVAVLDRPGEPEVLFCRLIGPMVEGVPSGEMHAPDLERLFNDMDTCQRGSPDAPCSAADLLGERLSETYDEEIKLLPGAASLMHGPFGSDDWPTATIVTGTVDDATSVLVADRSSNLACCVLPEFRRNSGLNLYSYKVGDVELFEITPLPEPRLLPYFPGFQ